MQNEDDKKKRPSQLRKIYNGDVRPVENQIIRWRRELRKKEITIGRATAKAKALNAKTKEHRRLKLDKPLEADFFGTKEKK